MIAELTDTIIQTTVESEFRASDMEGVDTEEQVRMMLQGTERLCLKICLPLLSSMWMMNIVLENEGSCFKEVCKKALE